MHLVGWGWSGLEWYISVQVNLAAQMGEWHCKGCVDNKFRAQVLEPLDAQDDVRSTKAQHKQVWRKLVVLDSEWSMRANTMAEKSVIIASHDLKGINGYGG